jgi:hypothetical protein
MALLQLASDTSEPLHLPDVRQLDQMPSLPAWLALPIASIKIESQRDRDGILSNTEAAEVLLKVNPPDLAPTSAGTINAPQK